MTCHTPMEFSLHPIISERVTNLNVHHVDLVHCPICSYILWKPVTCSLCENSFCFQCIQTWLVEQQEQIIEQISHQNENDDLGNSFSFTRCPFNCSPYQERKCPPLLITILSKLTIECRNKSYGCEEILCYEQLEKHEEEFCQYKIIQCPGCKQNMFKESFDKDKHLSKCLYIELQCTKCQCVFKRKDQHDQLDCMEKQIDLLRENMFIFQQKSSKIFDIQRNRIDILNQKIILIEDIWAADDDHDEEIDQKLNSTPRWTQLLNLQSIRKWEITIGFELFIVLLLMLLIYIRIFFS